MRKIFKNMAWTMAATLVMAACSDSLDESSGNGNSNEFIGDKGYVNIGINLPTTPSTRSESFDDGKAEEYKVDKVIIALFYGGTEKEAECKCAFQLTDKDFLLSDDATNNITSYYATGVRMIPAPDANVYALAIVNPISKFNVGTITSTNPDKENVGDATLTTYLTVDEGSGANKFKGTLSDLNKVIAPTAITDVTGNSYNYFLMTNAPISTKASFTGSKPGDLEIQTLAPIKVYNDKALAEGASKDNPIYVERAVAKTQVAVEGNDATLTVTTDVTSYKNATVKFEGWKLQNTNKKYYPVRRVNALDSETDLADINTWLGYFNGNESNRFIGTTPNPYRTYWGIDPNYDKNENDEDLSKDYTVLKSVNEGDWNEIGYSGQDSEIEYCLENTTTAQTMAENRLTSVLLKATFTPDGATASTSFFMINNTSAIYTEEEFLKVATAALKGEDALIGNEELAVKTVSTGFNITDATGVQSLLQINGGTDQKLSDTQAAAILAAAGGNIKYYLQGITYYYATVIKHFGDTETPLASDVINDAKNYDEGKHLGRYGVLRNNWYELTIKSVKGPGEPEIPEIPVTPPDKKESYINCEINILSWAKRSQGVDL
ncbi:putative uncharacterized protein [Bacteroides sp. CAG:633]|uniref:Mfa1 family fimbria major subunit n=1 Tax=Bacteroides sp. CAG:633 TaxID=1262744 RepID=UPI0003392499|nr:Mfa1 family fimbria major subunit [Bacteroides sp. CAG:633]CDB11700.1 putative uncharacterized protein [Bacteroides sp. CAG:633]